MQARRCIKLAYARDHDSPCPSYLSKVRDLSILPRILQVDMPWWNLNLEQIASLVQQDIEDCRQTLAHDMRTIGAPAMEEVGRNILQYRSTIKQDLPFRLKRLHVWNVSGWTPSQTSNDPKLRLIKRLLRTGPVSLQETRWHEETPEALHHAIPGLQVAHTAGIPTDRGGISGGAAVLIPPGWRLDRTEEIIPGRAVLAVIQDRYSTIGLISIYLHPNSKGTELRELVTWIKQQKNDHPVYQRGL